MKQWRKFKVGTDLRRDVSRILTTREIRHKFSRENDQWYCEVPLSGERFHKIVQRAMCEKRSREEGVTFLTYRESENPKLTQALLESFGTNGFVIVSKQKTK